MKMLMTWAVLLCAVVVGRAEELYDLRGPAPSTKYTVRSEFKEVVTDCKLIINRDGKSLTLDVSSTNEFIRERENLAIDGRTVTKCLTRILKEENEETVTGNGRKKADKTTSPLVGQVVISQKIKDDWKNRFDDDKPTPEQAKKLERFKPSVNNNSLYPKDKVKVGHKWEIDEKMLREQYAYQGKIVSGQGRGTFLKIEELNNEPCYVTELETKFKLELKSTSDKSTVEIAGKTTEYISIKTGITMKETNEGTMKIDIAFKNDDGDEMTIIRDGKISQVIINSYKEKK